MVSIVDPPDSVHNWTNSLKNHDWYLVNLFLLLCFYSYVQNKNFTLDTNDQFSLHVLHGASFYIYNDAQCSTCKESSLVVSSAKFLDIWLGAIFTFSRFGLQAHRPLLRRSQVQNHTQLQDVISIIMAVTILDSMAKHLHPNRKHQSEHMPQIWESLTKELHLFWKSLPFIQRYI